MIHLQATDYMERYSLPRGTKLEKDLEIQGLFFRLQKSAATLSRQDSVGAKLARDERKREVTDTPQRLHRGQASLLRTASIQRAKASLIRIKKPGFVRHKLSERHWSDQTGPI
ncbi:hypothetical protein [Pseudomonas chlororaphis]|uniref:hypothetical protein n=1 Tax=Pseudomonas chlororaphis TaxID=587753 RepID=UPI000F560DBD|nr:hypothetical protein [Pseudomonas chlororaphis]